ncbi:DUF4382 domain-containing protein [Flavihumibacter fluvii]|uniref:DUF4382 domain-containing protein n=1 Tax=Flavihumibacter fluvii TaxID=2838157 RepID=UPI001BDF3AD5|nr:DUF4382 domain-containing protein [Flavihumibacter fluvii]ULQ54601.1 DUF4382 domain-containing protein [Flavihumibacter fluvii]
MKTRFSKLVFPLLLLLTITVFYACQKETSSNAGMIVPVNAGKLSVYLTDGPYDFQKVLVDIKSIDVKLDTCHRFGDADNDDDEQYEGNRDSSGNCIIWTPLQINPGVYDLLQLRNGVDTLLGTTAIPQGKIRAVKITMGTNNSIMADSVVSPLNIWKDKNFVIIKIRNEHLDSVALNNFHLFLDFNLAKSIQFDNGTYWLRPYLKPFCRSNSGEIEGKVRPDSAYGMITAFNATDTANALPDHNREGEFKIRGLKEGSYSVLITGKNGYRDTTIKEVRVFNSMETDLGKIILHK